MRRPKKRNERGICIVIGQQKECPFVTLCNPPTANFAEIYQAYEKYKLQHHPWLIDFDDMLVLAYQGLLENQWLLKNFRQQTAYILTDESQNTSLLQHKLIKLIAQPQQNLFVVVDDNQSISTFVQPSHNIFWISQQSTTRRRFTGWKKISVPLRKLLRWPAVLSGKIKRAFIKK